MDYVGNLSGVLVTCGGKVTVYLERTQISMLSIIVKQICDRPSTVQ